MPLSRYLNPCSSPGSWKHHRWKTNAIPQPNVQHITVVSPNQSITHHSKLGMLDVARNLFDGMPQRTAVSWNAMISGYSKWGRHTEALGLVSDMHRTHKKLNEITYSTALSVCAGAKSLRDGTQLHSLVLRSGSEGFEFVGSSLLHFYSSCYEIQGARRVFASLRGRNGLLWNLMIIAYVRCELMGDAMNVFLEMPKCDVVSWTALISGYSKREDGWGRALELFREMMREEGGVRPNEFTFDCIVRICGRLQVLDQGRVVHGLLIRQGFEADCSVGDALVDFYCNCEAMDDARRVYDRVLVCPSLNASNSLIGGLISTSRMEDAKLIFFGLDEADSVSYNLMIKGYGLSGQVEDSKRLFEAMPSKSTVSLNTMISVYASNGEIDRALALFEEAKGEGDPVTWNSMLSGYIQNNKHEEALKLYVTMHRLLVGQTRSTFSALFRACSGLGSLQQGQLLHGHLIKTPFESNVYVGTSLIDMYSRCGSICDAQKSFDRIAFPNVAAWTALIHGHASHGLGLQAVSLFECMLQQGERPNAATFVGVLCACGSAGLVNEGTRLFSSMETRYGVIPSLEHYTCAVNLFGQSGCLREAEEFVKEMPIEADGVVWGTLLSHCWFWMDMEVGERVAEKMFELEPKPTSAYVIMSNIYARLGKWEQKMGVRKRLRAMRVKKDPGCSWLELGNSVHVFSVGDRAHPHCNAIYVTLEHLTENVNSFIQFEYDSISMPATCVDHSSGI